MDLRLPPHRKQLKIGLQLSICILSRMQATCKWQLPRQRGNRDDSDMLRLHFPVVKWLWAHDVASDLFRIAPVSTTVTTLGARPRHILRCVLHVFILRARSPEARWTRRTLWTQRQLQVSRQPDPRVADRRVTVTVTVQGDEPWGRLEVLSWTTIEDGLPSIPSPFCYASMPQCFNASML